MIDIIYIKVFENWKYRNILKFLNDNEILIFLQYKIWGMHFSFDYHFSLFAPDDNLYQKNARRFFYKLSIIRKVIRNYVIKELKNRKYQQNLF